MGQSHDFVQVPHAVQEATHRPGRCPGETQTSTHQFLHRSTYFWEKVPFIGEDFGKEITIDFLFNSSCSLRSGTTIHYVHEILLNFLI